MAGCTCVANLDAMGGIRASSIIEDTGFDRVEHAERAYTKEENFIMQHGRKFRNVENSTNLNLMRGMSLYNSEYH